MLRIGVIDLMSLEVMDVMFDWYGTPSTCTKRLARSVVEVLEKGVVDKVGSRIAVGSN